MRLTMTYNSIRHLSFSISLLVHLLLLILFLLINISLNYTPMEYVELSFGKSGETGSSGAKGTKIEKVEEISQPQERNETVDKSLEVKEVELPTAKNTEDENVIKPADKSKTVTEENKTENKETSDSKVTAEGQGNLAEGDGSFGYDIDWGGKGTRRIYSYPLPDYPDGVQKEINIRLQFTILADGTVGSIIPRTKADTRLENAAINALRKWKFEPLSSSQKQQEQTAVIVFPYRLQ